MQKMDIETADVQAVKRIIERRKHWRRFRQWLKRLFVRKKRSLRWRKWRSEAEMQQLIAAQIEQSMLWRENLMRVEALSPRYRATGKLKLMAAENPCTPHPELSFDISQMPTLQETDAIKIEELQFFEV
jgi:hypothetical protein